MKLFLDSTQYTDIRRSVVYKTSMTCLKKPAEKKNRALHLFHISDRHTLLLKTIYERDQAKGKAVPVCFHFNFARTIGFD